MIFDFFKRKHECAHHSVSADVEEAYCPDCGALVQNKWYIARCSCCGIKRTAHTRGNSIIPDTKFCTNCGSENFYVKELEKLNFTDIRHAVFKKVTVQQKPAFSYNQVWAEESSEKQGADLKALPFLSGRSRI